MQITQSLNVVVGQVIVYWWTGQWPLWCFVASLGKEEVRYFWQVCFYRQSFL
jgi:hypothetical protein